MNTTITDLPVVMVRSVVVIGVMTDMFTIAALYVSPSSMYTTKLYIPVIPSSKDTLNLPKNGSVNLIDTLHVIVFVVEYTVHRSESQSCNT